MKRKELIPYIVAILALLVGTNYDYQITDALYQSVPVVGIVFERFVLVPIECVVLWTMLMLYRKYQNYLFLLGAYVGAVYVVADFMHFWMPLDQDKILLVLVVSCIFFLIVYRIHMCFSMVWIQRHLSFFLFFMSVLLLSACITSVWKELWGRIRYRDIEDISQFCVWYKPCLMVGNRSFPSGHVTAMTTILCVLQWKSNRYENVGSLRYMLVTTLILIMALSRMIMGAHFLSDLAVGFMVSYTCYLFIRTLCRRRNYL